METKWNDTLKTGIITIAADEDFKTLIDEAITVFEARHDYQAVVFPVYTNEKEAIRLMIEDSVRLAVVTRDLNNEEKKEMESRNMYTRKHLIAFDGVALITHKMNPDSLISITTLKQILTGEITEWSQINPDTPLGAIRVLFEGKGSGVLRYVAESLIEGEKLSSNLYALNGNEEVVQRVIDMPNTIGLIGINFLEKNNSGAFSEKIRLMRVGKEDNISLENTYLPYAGDILQENYPLWRPVYALLSDPKSGLSSGFCIFLSQEIGQKIILKSGLLPITDPHILPVRIIR